MNKKYTLAMILLATVASQAQEQELNTRNNSEEIEEIVIQSQSIFPNQDANERASSHFHIGQKELKKYNYTDPNRVLMGKNGISVIEEDGFGLRPNIIIRGASSYRSSSINLMEDGILAAPAPYLAPAAYYFPTIGRMSGIEVLKSAGQILYGPNTIGGSLNMVSTQIPRNFSGNIHLGYGSFDTKNVHFNFGDRIGKFGYLVEFYNGSSRGFKNLPNGKDTGFNVNDGVIKLLYDNSDATIPNKLQFKLQTSSQLDNETYVGLTKEDFEKDPYQRYIGSELDYMKNNHRQYVLSYEIKPIEKLTLNFDIYHNTFGRNWYKINDVYGGVNEEGNTVWTGLSSALNKGNDSSEVQILKGTSTEEDTRLRMRNNNRTYYSQGIQLNGDYNVVKDGKLRFGIRYHREEEDRFQHDEIYKSTSSGLSLVSIGAPGSQTNRISTANATSSYLQYQHKMDKWTITGGLRYESIFMESITFAKADTERIGTNATEVSNKTNVLIPGFSVLYEYNDKGSLFASVHKGFAPAGTKEGQKNESSWNYELGTRWKDNFFDAEASAYVNNYSNLLGADTNAVGGNTGQGDMFNAGEVLIKGVEVYGKYTIKGKDSAVNFPIAMNYTYFHSSFKKDYQSDAGAAYGNVKKGDELPYIPNHLFTLEAGVNADKFSFSVIGRYRGDVRNKAGQGVINQGDLVPSVILIDAVARYQITPSTNFFVNGNNLLNKKYLATLNPSGYRPGMPLFVSVGANVKF